MLQWLGGSRRKVAATHTSVKKRQKQYFEQRRRQQQELTVGFDSCIDEINSSTACQREHRSLDILNLLNLSTAVPEHKSSCPEGGKIGKEDDLVVDSSALKPNIPGGTGSSSGFKVEPTPSKKTSFRVSDNQTNNSKRTDDRTDLLTDSTEQKLSVFDLVADDPTTNIEEDPHCEAHMAFSVEGLGKMNTETPVNSPHQSDRIYLSCRSPPWKVTSRPDISTVMVEHNDFEKEVDALLESNKMFQGDRPFRFSIGIQASDGSGKQKLHESREYRHKPYIHDSINFFPETANFNNRTADDENEWNASSIFLDDGEESMFLKDHLPFETESMQTDFLKYENDHLQGRSSADHYMTKKRNYLEKKERSSIQDSPVHRRHVPEINLEYPSSSKTFHFNSMEKFDFGNVFDPPVWSSFGAEEDKESLSLRSEESCSSSADWVVETSTIQRRRDLDSFHNIGSKNYMNNCFAHEEREDWEGGKYCKRKDGAQEYVRLSNQGKLKSTNHRYSSSFLGGLETSSTCFTEGFTVTNISSGSSHFSETYTMIPPSFCLKPSDASLDFLHSESLDIKPERENPHGFLDLELDVLPMRSSRIGDSVRDTWLPKCSARGGPENDKYDETNCLSVKPKLRQARDINMRIDRIGSKKEDEGDKEARQLISHKVMTPETTKEHGGETSSTVNMSENCKSLSEYNYEKEEFEAGHQGKIGTEEKINGRQMGNA